MLEDQAGSGALDYAAVQQRVGLSHMETGNPVRRVMSLTSCGSLGIFLMRQFWGSPNLLPHTCGETPKANVARQVPMPINTVRDGDVGAWY
jgi:hypothetical protein